MWLSPALRLCVRASLTLLLFSSICTAQEDEAQRETNERVADILTALGARDGAVLADVGSADGFYTVRMARAVAPSGRAFAVDIDPKALERLRQRAAKDGIANVETVLAAPDDPKLPSNEVDAVLIRNAYHEMPEYRAVLAGVLKGLKRGGTLVVIEAIHDNNRSLSREQQVKEHEIAPEIVETELREAGFEIVDRDDSFTKFSRPPPGGFWMIRATKP